MSGRTSYDRFLSPTGRLLHESAIRRMGTVVARAGDLVSFAPGYPDSALFPWDQLRAITHELLTGADGTVLQYGPTRGYAPLLEALVDVLQARHIKASLDELMITSGSQQGLDLVARVLATPGDVVLVELPTYTGGIAAFRNAQADLVGVVQEEDGISLDDLDEVWQRVRAAGKRAQLLYLVPNFQNPTGRLLALAKRRQVLEWAERRDVLIIEDDPYGALYFEDVASPADTRPIRADDERGRVIYLSTFSKTLAPGFRVGWMVAAPSLIDRFDTAKQSVDLTSGTLDQRVVHLAVRRGVLDALAPRLRDLYRRKRDVMEDALRRQLGDRLTWPAPKGGFFLWVRLPEGCDDVSLLERALEQRLVFVIGSAFYVDGAGHDRIRLSFSAPTPERIEEGVRRLAAALKPAPVSSL
ncbi:MAG: PLP-dependent aminotransferase family protein [Acidobacteria bacterium]|nr:PLP-dependent aminotransferase family protein [Acidobacteriota bacterium]